MPACLSCRRAPATTGDGLCTRCASRRSAAQALPLIGAAATAAGLLLGGAILAERLQSGRSPVEALKGLRSRTPTLDAFSRDLTALARAGALDPVIGRDVEIERIVAILARRTKNNPVLVGDPGVGKTAIVEGLAQRIAAGAVPPILRGKRIAALNLGALVAGTKYRGELEARVERLLAELARRRDDVILFIDELHALVGAGAAEGALDLSSMIKPALARGELRCVGATTYDEYRAHIEDDPALERRFQPVHVAEPSVEETIAIVRGLRSRYEAHHGVTLSDAALDAAANLAARYVADRFLPDKAIDLLDEAAACVAAARVGGRDDGLVTADDVAAVVTRWTGIPYAEVRRDRAQRLAELERRLRKRIVGQERAIAIVCDALRRAEAGIHDPSRPLGSFLFHGPAGVGKTELAKALAAALFGTDEALVRIDLNEFAEPHALARLIGAPPGYAGYGEPGQLTEPVRRRPFCVVLFDELERAHPAVATLLLRLLDEGRITDAKGRTVNFRHALVVMTTNLDETTLRTVLVPAFLDRLDAVVAFEPLSVDQVEAIVELHVTALAERVGAHHARLDVTPQARRFLAELSMRTGRGARDVARTLSQYLATPLANAVLRGELASGKTAVVSFDGERLTVRAA
jgi:ATP-dependent Clp protease ATP-binding subunit ClpC